jgi:CRISPR/Cas system endoribonuclease Cas6 (RAMP superfamily)
METYIPESEKGAKELQKILDELKAYADKASHRDYVVTPFERSIFNSLVEYVNNVDEWL